MFTCGCANPACAVNGCMIASGYRLSQPMNPLPMQQLITVEQIRQIIREELAAMRAEIGRGM